MDCIWLLPIYASPLRDGGYDISDFTSVLPDFGNIGDFVELVDGAHERGMRVVADLVMNHTSDAHPWFQASRTDPEGPFGDFYVWSDTDDRFPEARVIFVDPSIRTGPTTRCAASTTGTVSSPTSPT